MATFERNLKFLSLPPPPPKKKHLTLHLPCSPAPEQPGDQRRRQPLRAGRQAEAELHLGQDVPAHQAGVVPQREKGQQRQRWVGREGDDVKTFLFFFGGKLTWKDCLLAKRMVSS